MGRSLGVSRGVLSPSVVLVGTLMEGGREKEGEGWREEGSEEKEGGGGREREGKRERGSTIQDGDFYFAKYLSLNYWPTRYHMTVT